MQIFVPRSVSDQIYSLYPPLGVIPTNAAVSTSTASDDLLIWVLRVEILSDWKSLTAALLDDAAVEARSDASTTNLLLLLLDAAHKAVGGHLVPSRQESR